MDNPLFLIKDLACAYKNGNEVLTIRELVIPRNRFIVLVGMSGSGKSTFLETLGLMNNTIKRGDVLFYPTNNAEQPLSLKQHWEPSHKKEIARLRREYFSFIFQNTNLMQNFTAHENACLSQMILGVSVNEAMKNVKETMATMGLANVPETRNASELSGGQKQRLAFVRAITPDFTVLFGDEPTGNLDEFNSDELMRKLQQNIAEFNRTAIIVSHNIALSVKYADLLIVLKKKEDLLASAEVGQDDIYTKSKSDGKWYDWNNKAVDDFTGIIQQKLSFTNNQDPLS
jgi:ABC-type lipoprotein export system ATPase subunit